MGHDLPPKHLNQITELIAGHARAAERAARPRKPPEAIQKKKPNGHEEDDKDP